jgi:plastocyanin
MRDAGGGRRDLVHRGDLIQSGPKGLRAEERKMSPPLRQEQRCDIKRVAAVGQPNVFELKTDPIKADPADTIRWEIVDTYEHVISIWFPGTGVFTTAVVADMIAGPVSAKVRDDARPGEYEYAIYDHTDRQFVTCQSHPKIEIPGP